MKTENIKKHGGKLLAVLALTFLAAVLFRFFVNRASNKPPLTHPVIFTKWLEDNLEEETFNNLINEFEALHDEIRITLSPKLFEELRQTLINSDKALTEGDGMFPGDVIVLDPLWIPELLSKEIIESTYTPLISSINVFYYNIEVLKEAGFSRPPKTRSEVLNCARTLAGRGRDSRESTGNITSGLAMGLNSSRGIYDDIFPWLWSAGINLIQDGKPEINSRQVVESLSFFFSLNSEGLIVPGAFSANSEKKLEDFVSGKAAFMIAPARDIRFVRERMGDEAFGITSIPTPDNYAGKTFFGASAWTVGIHTASAHKEEAKLFADFLAEKASVFSGFSEHTNAIPGSGVRPSQDDFHSKVQDIAFAGESAPDFSGLPWTELEKAFKEELAAMFAEKSSSAAIAAAIQMKWETILEHWDIVSP